MCVSFTTATIKIVLPTEGTKEIGKYVHIQECIYTCNVQITILLFEQAGKNSSLNKSKTDYYF